MRPSDPEKLEKHFLEMLQKNIPEDGSPVEVYDMLDMMLLETVIDIFVDPSKDPEYKHVDPRPFVNGVNALLKINTFRVLLGYGDPFLPSKTHIDHAIQECQPSGFGHAHRPSLHPGPASVSGYSRSVDS